MSETVSFEVQSYVGGTWKIQVFFNDRELAIAEADRMEASKRHGQLRVVEERYDEARDEYLMKVIHRPGGQRNAPRPEPAPRSQAQAARPRKSADDPPPRRRRPREAQAPASTAYTLLALKAGGILAAGLAVLYALDTMMKGG